MTDTQLAQFKRNVLPQQYRRANGKRTLLSGRQDNPAAPRDRTAAHQPASPKNKIRPPLYPVEKEIPHPGRPSRGKTQPTTIHLSPRVKAELERRAEEEGLSVSATGAALIEHALQQSLYEQHAATLDKAVDTSIGRHMRTYSDRNAGLQARTIQKTEMVFQIATNLLARMPGMDESQMERILNDADDAARASIKRMTPKDKQTVEVEKAQFEKGSGGA